MTSPTRWAIFDYVGAIALAGVALSLQTILQAEPLVSYPVPHQSPAAFQCSILGVVVSAWLFRLPATLIGIFVAAFGQAFWFLPPPRSIAIGNIGDAIQFTFFILVSLVIAFLTDRLKRSRLANDVTLRELIKSNRARQVIEHRLDAGLNNMVDPIMILLPVRGTGGVIHDFIIEYINEPGAQFHAHYHQPSEVAPVLPSRSEQIGQRLSRIAPTIARQRLIEAFARVIETGTRAELNFVAPSRPSEAVARDIEVRANRLGDGLIVNWRDVSERAQAQRAITLSAERYRSLVEAIGAIVWSMPANGEFETPQLEWSVFTGQRFEELKGWGWLDAVHSDDRTRTSLAWTDAIRRRIPFEVEHRLRRADGEYRDMLVKGVPLVSTDGEVREWIGVHTDITERRRAEQIIADSERQLRRVLNALYAFVAVLTPDGTLVGANEAPLKAAGISAADVIGRKFWDCYWWAYSPEIQQRLQDWVEKARTGEVIREDIQMRVADGSMVCLDLMLSPMRDENGDITHLIPSGVDVSDRKRAQAELADRERHYRQLTEGLPMLTWTSLADGEFDYLSQRWSEYTGSHIKSHLSYGWLDAVHPEDRPALIETWKAAVAAGERLEIEFRLRRHDGEYRWFDTRAEPIRNVDGVVIRWFGTCLDVHDRKSAEQRFRRLYESNLAGIVFYHYDGTLTDPNDAFYTLLGYDPSSEKPQLNWRALTPPNCVEADDAAWRQIYEMGQCAPFEKEFYRVDGSRVPVMVAAADLEPGNHEHGVAYVVDMTHVKSVEEALRRTEASLRTANESLEHRIQERTLELQHRSDQLRALALDLTETESRERKRLAQILHDHFQQLVSAAKLKVGIVRRRLTDPALIETVREVESLLEETINASRSLATELSPPVLHDAGLAAAFDWLARRMEKDHNLQVNIDYDPRCEPDNEQVRTILFECARELLFNVVKHASSLKAELAVSMPQEGLLQLTVTDQGKGFDSQEVELKPTSDGSFGLLSIKERLGLLGGLLRVKSAVDVGTSVQMTVPVTVKRDLRGTHAGSLLDPLPGMTGKAVPNVRVLVADDHRLFREGLISLISQESFVEIVGQANDGEEAIAMSHRLKPDILICDVTMPKLTGIQVTTQLSKELPDLKVIGLSMHERDDMASAMIDAGAAAYCTKSGPMETLINVLRSVAAITAAKQ